MEEIRSTKAEIRKQIATQLEALDDKIRKQKNDTIETRLFEFANFLESKIVLLYVNNTLEVDTRSIIARSYDYGKIVVLPSFEPDNDSIILRKIDNAKTDLKPGGQGLLVPDPQRCKIVPIERIDIAIIPGVALDEKGGRIGSGDGYYDRLIPDLPLTTRKVALAFEDQLINQIPMEAHDRYVDIIISDERIIYKI